MKIIVCGGRDFDDYELVCDALDDFVLEKCPNGSIDLDLVIQGGADGADELAADWAKARGVPCLEVPADWRKHGSAAGPIRNAKMLAYLPDCVIAFPGGKGTADMVAKARQAGVRVEEIK